MKQRFVHSVLSCLLTVGLLAFISCATEKESAQKAADDSASMATPENTEAIKAAMQTYIDAKLAANNNVYSLGELEGTYDYLHDGINEMGGMHVSCADVKVGEEVYDVDLYVARSDTGFEVVKEVIHKKGGAEVNELLWEKASE